MERNIDMAKEELSDIPTRHSTEKLTELIDHLSDSVLDPNNYLFMLAERKFICLVKKKRIQELAIPIIQYSRPPERNFYIPM